MVTDSDGDGVDDGDDQCPGVGESSFVQEDGEYAGCIVGDFDASSSLDELDVIQLGQKILNAIFNPTPLHTGTYDLNCDDLVDENDVIMLGQTILDAIFNPDVKLSACS